MKLNTLTIGQTSVYKLKPRTTSSFWGLALYSGICQIKDSSPCKALITPGEIVVCHARAVTDNDPARLTYWCRAHSKQYAPVLMLPEEQPSLEAVLARFIGPDGSSPKLRTTPAAVFSFGFIDAVPSSYVDATDLLVDVRQSIKNPWRVESLRKRTGLDADVRAFVFSCPRTHVLMQTLETWATMLGTGNIYIGCHGGKHRSVALAEALGLKLNVSATHFGLSGSGL